MEGNLNLNFNWGKLTIPSAMRTLIYAQNGNLFKDSLLSSGGGNILLTAGAYKIISFNNDATDIRFSNLNNFDQAEGYTESILRSTSASEPIIEQPDMLYGAVWNEFSISSNEVLVRNLEILRYVKPIRLIIQMDQIANILSCKGSLSGISQTINLSTGNTSATNPATVEFETVKENNLNFSTTIRTFGPVINPDTTILNRLTLDFTKSDGSTEHVSANVSFILRNMEEDGLTIVVLIQFLQGVGFTTVVKEWQTGVGAGNVN